MSKRRTQAQQIARMRLRLMIKLLTCDAYGVYLFSRLGWRAIDSREERHWVN